jgi:hypothetical protein
MKRFVLSVLATGALLGVGIACQAQTLTYELLTDTDWTTIGVSGTNSGGGTGMFDPLINNILFTPTPNPTDYRPPSVLKFGDDFTGVGNAGPSSFTNFDGTPVDFHFTLTSNGSTDLFHAVGRIDGLVGYGDSGAAFSQAKITFTGLDDLTTGASGTASIDPNNGLGALRIVSNIGGQSAVVYLDTPQSKPAPNLTLTTAGFINVNSAVPEPGTVALLASSCISGSVFLLRRMRRA